MIVIERFVQNALRTCGTGGSSSFFMIKVAYQNFFISTFSYRKYERILLIFKVSIIRNCKKCICKSQIILPKWHLKLKVVCLSFEEEEEERGREKQQLNHIKKIFFARKLFVFPVFVTILFLSYIWFVGHQRCGILASQPGIKPALPPLEG